MIIWSMERERDRERQHFNFYTNILWAECKTGFLKASVKSVVWISRCTAGDSKGSPCATLSCNLRMILASIMHCSQWEESERPCQRVMNHVVTRRFYSGRVLDRLTQGAAVKSFEFQFEHQNQNMELGCIVHVWDTPDNLKKPWR